MTYNEKRPDRERFAIGQIVIFGRDGVECPARVDKLNPKTMTVTCVRPFKSFRKLFPQGSQFRVPYRYVSAAKPKLCKQCNKTYFVRTDEYLDVECDCE